MMIAGETSGDIHGAGLIRCLRKNNKNIDFFGIGGSRMLEEKFRPYYMLETLQAHGLFEVILHLPRLYKTLWEMRFVMLKEHPDALILIDYPGFNLKLASYAKGKGIPVIFFNSPQIWAWRKGRLNTIRRAVDKMIVLFPFEKEIYQQAGVDVKWVGHPLLDQKISKKEHTSFLTHFKIRTDIPVLVIAPGSRPSEMRRHLPTLIESLPHIQNAVGKIQCILPITGSLNLKEVKKIIESSTVPIKLIMDKFLDSIHSCDAAIVASGTASLQTGLALKPFVIIYRVSPLTFWVASSLTKTKHIGMVNILAEKEIAPELLQEDFKITKVVETTIKLLQDKAYRAKMIGELEKIRSNLGTRGAYQKAASYIEDYIFKN